jgi:hypothetical protein
LGRTICRGSRTLDLNPDFFSNRLLGYWRAKLQHAVAISRFLE